MLHVYLGTDRDKTRAALNSAVSKRAKDREKIRITDAHSIADLDAALGGAGLFGQKRAVVLDEIFSSEEMRERILENLPHMRDSDDIFFILEEKLDAATKRSVGKYAEAVESFDLPKGAKEKDSAIFKMRFALEKGDRKVLWVSLMREYANGKPPEAVHGFLFWAAKQIFMNGRDKNRGKRLLITLAELPHEARRKGFDLEYALERFVLSGV